MGSTRRSFTDEYEQQTVELVISSGRSNADVAKSIGVNEMTLGSWVKKARDEGQGNDTPLTGDERAELERLREENKRLRMEAEFAKKKSGDLVRERRAVVFAAIADWADHHEYPVTFMCRQPPFDGPGMAGVMGITGRFGAPREPGFGPQVCVGPPGDSEVSRGGRGGLGG